MAEISKNNFWRALRHVQSILSSQIGLTEQCHFRGLGAPSLAKKFERLMYRFHGDLRIQLRPSIEDSNDHQSQFFYVSQLGSLQNRGIPEYKTF